MSQEEQNFDPELSPQEIAWGQEREDTDNITDLLGKEVDNGIKEAVTAFRVYDFTTSQSCEGHIEEGDHGRPFPWVEIYTPEPEELAGAEGEEKAKIETRWTHENLEQQQKMLVLLTEFYQNRETPFDARLTFDRVGAFGGFSVQSFGGNIMKLLPPDVQREKLTLYRKEMHDFTTFLKDKYFSEQQS